jgi:hypothetical protein
MVEKPCWRRLREVSQGVGWGFLEIRIYPYSNHLMDTGAVFILGREHRTSPRSIPIEYQCAAYPSGAILLKRGVPI